MKGIGGDAERKLADVEQVLRNIVRDGVVSSVDDAAGTARVAFSDQSGVVSYDLRVMQRNTHKNQDYAMPDVGEQVLCLFLPVGVEAGFILGSFYGRDTERPANTRDIRATVYEDGTRVEYNRESHALTVDVPEGGSTVTVNCAGSVTVNCPKIDLGEDADLEPSVLGDKLAAWIVDVLKVYADGQQHIGNLGVPTSPASAVLPFDVADGAAGGNVYSQKNRNQ